MSTEKIAERANDGFAENIRLPPMPDKIEIPIHVEPPKRTRKARKLAWNERQYGAGLVAGIFIGIAIGVPLDAIMAVAAKWFVTWITTW